MRKLIPFCFLAFFFTGCSTERDQPPPWVQLFNGKDLDDWKIKITGYSPGENFGNTFRVEDGNLTVNYEAYPSFDGRFGHIFYKSDFSCYLLGVEYRFTGEQCPGGADWAYRNSGIMIHGQAPETMLKNQDFPISIEVQLLGGNGKDPRTTANLCTPGTNVVMHDSLITDHCISSSSKTYHGDQWVRVEVLVLGDSVIKHIIDKQIVLEYENPQMGNGVVNNYDTLVKKDGHLLTGGSISLQSESHPVEFRKIEIIDLDKYMADRQKLAKILGQLNVPEQN